jgi:L-lactate dehydrogenase
MHAPHHEQHKVSIVGCGKVGRSIAYSLLQHDMLHELTLLGRTIEKVRGDMLDMEHALPFLSKTTITATTDYADLANSDIVVFSAGVGQKPGQTRLDLAKQNIALVQKLIPQIVKHAPHAIIMMITNPVDVLTFYAIKASGLSSKCVFGSGTLLDTARFRSGIGSRLHVNPRSVHAYILGEHGDSSFPVISSAVIGGKPLLSWNENMEQIVEETTQEVRQAAYEIIKLKGATEYAIGAATTSVISTILRDRQTIIPVSSLLNGHYGLHDVCLSIPCVVGREGIIHRVVTPLNDEEQQALHESARIIKQSHVSETT